MVVGADQNSRVQNESQVSCYFAGSPVRQGMQSDVAASSWRGIPGIQSSDKVVYQQYQQHKLQHQLLKCRVHQSNICDHQHQEQQHIVSQPSQFKESPCLKILPELQKPLSMEQLNSTTYQLNQFLGQENTVEQQQLSFCRKNMPNSIQQPVGLQSNVVDLQQPLRMFTTQSNVMNLRSHPHSELSLQQVGHSSSKQRVQQTGLPLRNNQLPVLQKKTKQDATHQRLQSLSVPIRPQNVINQQKQQLSQGTNAEVPSASVKFTAPSELANIVEWHDQAYRKIQSMKEEYVPQLKDFYRMLDVMRQKTPGPEMAEKYNKKMIALEKLVRFLFINQNKIVELAKTEFEEYQEKILQAVKCYQVIKSGAVRRHAQLGQSSDGQSLVSQLQQLGNRNLQFSLAKSTLTSTPVDSFPSSSMQQGILSSQPQQMSLLHSDLQMGLEQRNIPSSLQQAARSANQNIEGAQQSSTVNPFQQQVKHQMKQPQDLKRHIQPQIQQKMQQRAKPGIQLPATSGMLQQQPLISQLSEHHFQMLLPPAPCQVHSTSPKMSKHSSSQVDQLVFSSLSIGGELLHSLGSTSTTASSSASLTPFSITADHEILTSSASPLSDAHDFVHPQTAVASTKVDTQNSILNQSVAAASSGISTSCLHIKSTNPDGNQQSSSTKQPLKRLLDAVESLSAKSLSAAVSEIGSVVNSIDTLGGTDSNYSRAAVGEDLTFGIRHRLQEGKFRLPNRCTFVKNINSMARKASSSSLCKTNDPNLSTGQIYDLSESTATSRIKRRRIEPINALLDEIRDINELMVETIIDLDPTEDTATVDAGEGTIVRCTYHAVAFNENFGKQCASEMLPVLSLRLLVGADYPNSSPIILDALNIGWSSESKDLAADLTAKTRLRFNKCLRQLSEPMSLAEMVLSWDVSAHKVYEEFAQQVGGGCFSSRYGNWENCATA